MRRGGYQPELPLGRTVSPAPPPSAASASTSDSRPPEWHLDEQTRRVGKAGVAAARALLGARTPRPVAGHLGDETIGDVAA